jgi:hypothetical protein
MADIEKKILLDIQTTAVENLAKAQTAIQGLREEIKKQSKDYANNSQSIAENQLKIKQLQGVVSEQTKIAMNANAQINGNVGAYKALSLQYAVSAQRAKDLSAEFGVNSVQAKKAQLEANGLNDKLKAIDKTVGQNQRSVGDYGTALNGLKDKFLSFVGVTAIIGAVSNAFKDAMQTMKAFDQQMAKVGAITNATGKELKQLKQLAIDLAGSSKYSATEVAGLEEELGKLGFTSQQIIDASEGIVMASSATGESLEKTAEIVGSVTSAFGLNASESKRVADVMSQSFNATALGLDNFSESIKYVAPIAKQAGVSLEETTALLGLLANNGIKGSQAGTSLRQILSQLSGEGGTLQEKLAKLSKEGLTLAGAEDEVGRNAKTALLVLKDNAEVLPTLTKEFENSAGASKVAAEKMLDTISGKTTLLTRAWESLILSLDSGEGAFSKGYKSLIEGLTSAIKGTKLLMMSESEREKELSKTQTKKRLEDLDVYLRHTKNQVGYINQEIQAEKALIKAKEDKIKVLQDEIKANDKKGFLTQSTELKKANEEEIRGLREAANRSVDYVNALGNLRRAKQDENKILAKEAIEKEKKLQAERAEALKEQKELEEKAIELQRKKTDDLLKANERILASKRKTFEEEGKFQIIDPTIVAYRLKQLETFTQQEKLNVIARAKFEKKTKEELTAELQAVDAKLKSDQTALLQKAGQDTIEHNNRLVEIDKLKNEEIMAGKRLSIDDQLKADTLAIELTKVNAKKEIDEKKKLGLIGEVEYQDEIAKIDQQAKTDLAKANAQFIFDENEKEYNAKKANIDRELALAYNTADEEYKLTLEKLELEKQAEIKKAKETGESIDLIEKEYAQKAEQANFDKLQRQTDQYVKYGESIANVFGAFSDLMKANEDAELQKDAEANEAKKANLQERLDKGLIDKKTFDKEVANSEKELDNKKKKIEREQAIRARILSAFGIIASTAQGIMKSFADLGPVAGIPFAIAVGAVGALQMATLLSAPLPKASRGTLLRGASHANGGIPIEAEGGEAIINKRSTSMFLPVLSAINEAGGGVPFVQTMADGGYVSRNSNQQSVSGSIADIVRATISEMKIYTTIEDIRREDKKYTNIEASANF